MDVLLIILLVSLNGLLAMAEIAVVSSRKSRLYNMAKSGNTNASIALDLAKKPSVFLSTIQIGITLISILIGAFGEANLVSKLDKLLVNMPILGNYSNTMSFLLIIGSITFLSIVIGEILPKRIALVNPEKIATLLAPYMNILSKITAPLVSILTNTTDIILKILHIKPIANLPVTEEEVRLLVREGAKIGIFNKTEKKIIERVLRLDDLKVSALITPRNQIQWIDIKIFKRNPKKVLQTFTHARIVLCDKTLDNVIGIIQTKEIFNKDIDNLKEEVIDSLIHKPAFIPENMKALKVLEMFRNATVHMALVIDEFGNVQGLVTFKDILEALIGNIEDVDNTEDDLEIIKRENGSVLVDGMLSTDDLKDLLKIEKLPKEHLRLYETLGGFIISYLDKIPVTGESFEWDKYRFEIVDMDGHRIDKVLVSPLKSKKK